MDIIAKISKGSNMDQIYLSKNRLSGLSIGQYVKISPVSTSTSTKPFFYNVKNLEPLKLEIIENIFKIIESIKPQNIIITGSFLESGFRFNDIDILIIKEEGADKNDIASIKEKIENTLKIKAHIIPLTNKTLLSGLSTDPLYSLMLSKCISKNRIIFNIKRELNYKILDLQFLKSKALIDNFSILNGEEKYYLILNMFSIMRFMQNKKLSREDVNKEIEGAFNIKIKEIRDNMLIRESFIKKYKEIYNRTFTLIMKEIK